MKPLWAGRKATSRETGRTNDATKQTSAVPEFPCLTSQRDNRHLRCRDIVLIFAAELAQKLFVTGEAIDWSNLHLAGIHPAV